MSPDNTHSPDSSHDAAQKPSRRRFLQSAAAAAAVTAAPLAHAQQQAATPAVAPPPASLPMMPVKLIINGHPYELQVEARTTLLDALREYAGLTGTKKGCDRGKCGECTVML